MRIIKEGKTTFTVTCPICGCKFEYNRDEVTICLGYSYVRCPCCNHSIKHKENSEVEITYENMPSIPEGKILQYEGQEGPGEPSIEQPADVNPLSKGLHDDVRCPYCGESDYHLTGSTCTLMYCQTRIKNGKVVDSKDKNIHTTHCHCNHCGKTFKIVNDKVEK